jgi:hypothetical protein
VPLEGPAQRRAGRASGAQGTKSGMRAAQEGTLQNYRSRRKAIACNHRRPESCISTARRVQATILGPNSQGLHCSTYRAATPASSLDCPCTHVGTRVRTRVRDVHHCTERRRSGADGRSHRKQRAYYVRRGLPPYRWYHVYTCTRYHGTRVLEYDGIGLLAVHITMVPNGSSNTRTNAHVCVHVYSWVHK